MPYTWEFFNHANQLACNMRNTNLDVRNMKGLMVGNVWEIYLKVYLVHYY